MGVIRCVRWKRSISTRLTRENAVNLLDPGGRN